MASLSRALGKHGVAMAVAALAVAFMLLCGLSWLLRKDGRMSSGQRPKHSPDGGSGGCSLPGTKAGNKGSCSNNPDIAPVMEASFNAVQIIKQSLLLEDHLNKEETRCPECMLKHILTMIALAEEAISLADNKEDEKFMQDAAHFYNGIMERIQAKDDECSIAGVLRAKRKDMMARYMKT